MTFSISITEYLMHINKQFLELVSRTLHLFSEHYYDIAALFNCDGLLIDGA